MGTDYSRLTYLLDAACRDSSRIEDFVSAMVLAGAEFPPDAIDPQRRLEFVQQAREFYQDFLFAQAKSGDIDAFCALIDEMIDEIAQKARRLRSVQGGRHVDAHTRSDFVASARCRVFAQYDNGELQLKSLGELRSYIDKVINNNVSAKGRRALTRQQHGESLGRSCGGRRAADPSAESPEVIFHVVRDAIPHAKAQELFTEMALRGDQGGFQTERTKFQLPFRNSQYLKQNYIFPALDLHQIPRRRHHRRCQP